MDRYPCEAEVKTVRLALRQYNDAQVGADNHTPLNLVKKDEQGNVIGGLLGGTYWGWMYVDILWVHEAHRNNGIGSALLLEAEREATRRGCHHVHLDTMSWQAPAFYEKRGYTIVATLPDIPKGYQKYLLQKEL